MAIFNVSCRKGGRRYSILWLKEGGTAIFNIVVEGRGDGAIQYHSWREGIALFELNCFAITSTYISGISAVDKHTIFNHY